MTPDELRQAFVTAGLSCRVQREEVVLEVCTFCGNSRFNLGCSPDKGVFYCWVCHQGGRLQELLHKLTGKEYSIPVQRGEKKTVAPVAPPSGFKSLPVSGVDSAARYLALREVSASVAAQYGIVVCIDQEHRLNGRIAFPAKDFWTGDLVGWIGRSYTGKEPKYLSTLTRKVITGWRTRDKSTPVVLVEGPMDGLTAHRAGFQVGVLSGTGSSGVAQWAARLPPQAPVAIMLDGEALQQAHQLYWKLHPLRSSAPLVVVGMAAGEDPASLGVEGVGALVRSAISASGHTLSSAGGDNQP